MKITHKTSIELDGTGTTVNELRRALEPHNACDRITIVYCPSNGDPRERDHVRLEIRSE